jgi:uncharacterized protein YegL
MRRLPIYFLIDVSESMIGEPIEQVETGMGMVINELRSDPYALETVWLSIIAFAGKTKKITPLMELSNFYPPKLPVGGGTSLGGALEFLMDEIDAHVVQNSTTRKGDWKPIVFLFTDGSPTDNVAKAIDRWNNYYRRRATMVAISMSNNHDNAALVRLTDTVLTFKNKDEASYKQFFKWVTTSIQISSVSVAEKNTEGGQLAKTDDAILEKIDLSKTLPAPTFDPNIAVFMAKCQNTRRPYLIKYHQMTLPSEKQDMNYRFYFFGGSYQIDEKVYADMSDNRPMNYKVNTAELQGFPSCPCCSNPFGFTLCQCGNIMCTGNEQISRCPSCGIEGRYEATDTHIDVKRTRG